VQNRGERGLGQYHRVWTRRPKVTPWPSAACITKASLNLILLVIRGIRRSYGHRMGLPRSGAGT
jgi:hypothetical protein